MHKKFRSILATIAMTLVELICAATVLSPSAAAQQAYVTNLFGNSVSVIDPSTNSITGTIPVGPNPLAVGFTPDNKHVYVANSNINQVGQGSISVIDTSTNTVVATIPNIGTEPIAVTVSPDGTRAWIPCSGQSPIGITGAGSIAIVDTAANAIVGTISSGVVNPIAAVFSLDGTHAFVTDYSLGEVLVFDAATNSLLQAIPSPGNAPVQGIALTPDGKSVYVTTTSGNSVFTIDTSTFAASAPIPVGIGPSYVAISSDGSKAYVVNQVPDGSSNGSLSVIDTATNALTATVPLGLLPVTPAVTADDSKVFVTNAADNSISVINTSSNSVVATITSPGVLAFPWGIAITQESKRQSPEQMVVSLIATVHGMIITKLGTSLIDQLRQVENDVRTRNGFACQDLSAFAHHVKAQAGKSITFAEADQLLQTVSEIEAALNC